MWPVASDVVCSVVCVLGTPTSPAKMDEPIEMLFGTGQTRVSHESIIGATWRIRFNDPCAVAMWPYVKLLKPLVIINAALNLLY